MPDYAPYKRPVGAKLVGEKYLRNDLMRIMKLLKYNNFNTLVLSIVYLFPFINHALAQELENDNRNRKSSIFIIR